MMGKESSFATTPERGGQSGILTRAASKREQALRHPPRIETVLSHRKNVVFDIFAGLDAGHFAHGLDVVEPIVLF